MNAKSDFIKYGIFDNFTKPVFYRHSKDIKANISDKYFMNKIINTMWYGVGADVYFYCIPPFDINCTDDINYLYLLIKKINKNSKLIIFSYKELHGIDENINVVNLTFPDAIWKDGHGW